MRTAIAAIHDTKTRRHQETAFEALIADLPAARLRLAPARPVVQPANVEVQAQRELAVPGRYWLIPGRPAHKSWFQQAVEWVQQKLSDLLKPLFSHLHVGKGGATLLGDALILLFVLIVAFVGVRLAGLVSLARDRTGARITPLEAQRNAHALMLQAAAHADEARYADAVRLLFRAAVTLLDLRGAITDDVAATVNELRRELAQRHSSASLPFDALAGAFSAAAYAERPVSQHDWQRARTEYDSLSALVTQ